MTDKGGEEHVTLSQEVQKIVADYERMRKLLRMEQQRPIIFEKNCLVCERRKNRRAAIASQTLRHQMFSGKTFGSRYLLAALDKLYTQNTI